MNGWTVIRALSRMCRTLEALGPLSAEDLREIREYEAQGLPVLVELRYYVPRCDGVWARALRWYAAKSEVQVVFDIPEDCCGQPHRFRLRLPVTPGQAERLLTSRSLRLYSAFWAAVSLVEVEERAVLLAGIPQIRDLIAEEEGEP